MENVISRNMEESAFDGNLLGIEVGKDITEVYYQMYDESLGDPCFIPTNHEKEEYLDLVQKLEEFDYSLASHYRQLID